MRLLQSFFYDFKNVFTIDDKGIVILAASLFLPYPITVAVVVIMGIYILVKSNFRTTLKSVRRSYLLMLFGIYLLLVSLIFGNYLGALLSVGMILLFIDVIHYRRYIHKEMFDIIIDVMIILSIASVIASIFEQFYYLNTVEKMTGFFDIQNKPEHRVHAFFFNANYYSMMIVFVEMFCVYRFMTVNKLQKRLLYTAAGLVNLFALFLTGGRIAWLCMALGLLVMIVTNKWYKTFIAACLGIGGGVAILATKPGLIPRLASKGLDLGRRARIYEAAGMMIEDTWLFGHGPLTYFNLYDGYYDDYVARYGSEQLNKLGISAPHSHSMFLEPWVSFGVIGTAIIGWYLVSQMRRVFRLFTRGSDRAVGSLILGCVVMTLAFCIIDFPIFWVQTGGLFLILLGSTEMFKKDVE